MRNPWNADNFWEPGVDDAGAEDGFTNIQNYENTDTTWMRFRYGEPIDAADFAKVRLWAVCGGPLDDYFANPLSWHIISDRFAAMLKELDVKDQCQLLPAPIFDEKTRESINGYHILNPLRRVDCLDKERSGATYEEPLGYWFTTKVHLHRDMIPADARLFRVGEMPSVVVFRGDIAAEYYKRGYTGAWFQHMPTEGEEYIDTEELSWSGPTA